MRNLKVSHRLVLMPCLAGLAFLLVLLTTHWAAGRYAELNVRIEAGYSPALDLSRDLEDILAQLQRGLHGAVAAADETLLDEMDGTRDSFARRLMQARGNPVLESTELEDLDRALNAYYALARETSARMIRGETGESIALAVERMRVEYNGIRESLRAFRGRQTAAMNRAFAGARNSHSRSISAVTVITVLCMALLAGISLLTIRSVTTQLREAVRVAENVALDTTTPEVRVTSADELGMLLARMRTMVARVQEREEALRRSEERYALAARGANDGLWDWDLPGRKIYFSHRWKSMLGYAEGEVAEGPEDWMGRIHPDDLSRVESGIEAHLAGRTEHFESEHRMICRDGGYRWVLSRGIAVKDAQGQPCRMAGSQSDITERKQAEEQLLRDAFYDPLTGLPNRALFMDRLRNALRRRTGRPGDAQLAVVFVDVDRFKLVNDSLGHAVGDELLRSLAQRLQSCLRPGDTVARFGGDEFTLLLEDVGSVERATRVADRVRAELFRPFAPGGHEVFATVSMGIALSAGKGQRPEDLLRDADNAMHRAKEAGRARYEVFDTEMHRRSMALLRLEGELRRAVEREEFRIHYQPIVDLLSGGLAGFEALVRWQHPERGIVLPSEFIPLAEETGLVVPIGEWVLLHACRQMQAWSLAYPGLPGLRMSANLSTRQFAQPDLAGRVQWALDETGTKGSSLHLEITESAVMETRDSAARTLARLKELGIRISIDDFGTGYSSLSYLQRLPIDTLKIDQSFVGLMGSGSRESEIVRTIVALAHNLGMSVVAEGVERVAQETELRALGCDYGQGFLYAEPLDALAAARMLSEALPTRSLVAERLARGEKRRA